MLQEKQEDNSLDVSARILSFRDNHKQNIHFDVTQLSVALLEELFLLKLEINTHYVCFQDRTLLFPAIQVFWHARHRSRELAQLRVVLMDVMQMESALMVDVFVLLVTLETLAHRWLLSEWQVRILRLPLLLLKITIVW